LGAAGIVAGLGVASSPALDREFCERPGLLGVAVDCSP
jgi:hypothetical protein